MLVDDLATLLAYSQLNDLALKEGNIDPRPEGVEATLSRAQTARRVVRCWCRGGGVGVATAENGGF